MTNLKKHVRIIDVETTGIEDDDQLVEIASVDWNDGVLGNPLQTLTRPSIPIPPEVSAIHHITDSMVEDAPVVLDALQRFQDANIFAAHNAKFDQRFLGFEAHWICTYKCALHIWPEAPNHKNQTLRYWLDLAAPPMESGQMAHRALYDAWTTAHIFVRLTDEMTINDMVQISKSPALLPKLHFGKHAGVPIAEVPKDYLAWLVGQDFDEDTMHTAKHYLG
jgi:exodeoxyribonuclease X